MIEACQHRDYGTCGVECPELLTGVVLVCDQLPWECLPRENDPQQSHFLLQLWMMEYDIEQSN